MTALSVKGERFPKVGNMCQTGDTAGYMLVCDSVMPAIKSATSLMPDRDGVVC